jgi:hypothetical protein
METYITYIDGKEFSRSNLKQVLKANMHNDEAILAIEELRVDGDEVSFGNRKICLIVIVDDISTNF